jgi:predicted AlkP superfamily phosphohydrolase/phosphomutase
MSSPKLIVIGLDSADHKLVSHWCDTGELPVLRSIRDRGISGTLAAPPALGDDAVWASFYTGVSPGRHGRYHHRQLRPGSYELDNYREVGHEPFWDVLSRAGRKVAIVDVPKCPLSKNVNGLHVTDWRVHGREFSTNSWPPEVGRNLLQRFGDDRTDRFPDYLCLKEELPEAQHDTFVEHLLDSTRKKTLGVLELLGFDAWDLFLVVFKEAHCVAHQLWHCVDTNHPKHRAGALFSRGNPVKEVYEALDAAIGQVLARVDAETNVIVFSDLGMATNVTGEHLLDTILLRLDGRILPFLWQRLQKLRKRFKHHRTEQVTDALIRRLYRYRSAFQVEHNELSGAVRVNVKGREPDGRIPSGPKFEAFLDQLVKDLLELENPDSGQPIVSEVLRTSEVFAGEHRDFLPDIFVVWNKTCPITAASSPKVGEVRIPSPHWRPGDHASDGFFFAYGPSVPDRRNPESSSIVDLAPSIGRLLGVSIPDVDGKCIAGLCE